MGTPLFFDMIVSQPGLVVGAGNLAWTSLWVLVFGNVNASGGFGLPVLYPRFEK